MVEKPHMVQQTHQLKGRMVPGGTVAIDAEAVARAEKVIAAMADEYVDWATKDLVHMEALLDHLSAAEAADAHARVQELFEIAHNVKGQGGSFGYPLITEIGNLLCRYCERVEQVTEEDVRLLRHCLDSMRMILTEKLTGDGGPKGTALRAGLHNVKHKIYGADGPIS